MALPSPKRQSENGEGRASFVGRTRTMGLAREWLRNLRWMDSDGLYIVVDDRL